MSNRFRLQKIGNNPGLYTQVYKDGIKGVKGIHENGLGDVVIRFKTNEGKDHKINVTKYYGYRDTKDIEGLNRLRLTLKKKAEQGLSLTHTKKDITLDELFELYLENRVNKKYNEKDLGSYKKNISTVLSNKITVGGKFISNLEIEDFQKVVHTMELRGKKYGTIKRILGLAKKALKIKEAQKYSPKTLDFSELHYQNKDTRKTPLDERITTPLKTVAVSIFSEIMKIEDSEMRLFLLLTTQCVRRTGEVFQLRVDDFFTETVNARSETTKEKRQEQYPVSKEIVSAFNEHIKKNKLSNNDKVFLFKRQRPYADYFERMVNNLINEGTIKINKPIYDETRYTQHDNRSLLGVLLNRYFSEDMIGKNALSHSDKNVDGGYTKANMENRKTVLSKWWAILRDETQTETSTTQTAIKPLEHEITKYASGNIKSYYDKDRGLLEGYYENSKPYYEILIEDGKPKSGKWWDENDKQFICNRAFYLK